MAHQEQNNNEPRIQVTMPRNQAQGYLLLAAGIILFLYSAFGFLEYILDFIIALASLGLILYGARQANLFAQLKRLWNYLVQKYKNRSS